MDSITVSNRLESLFDILCDRLFLSDSKVFATRRVVVPSWSVKEWLQRQFAETLGISMGIEFLSLEGAVARLGVGEVIGERALALCIEEELATGTIPQPAELLGSGKKMRPRRMRAVARDLSRLFHLYSLYGRELISQWEAGGGGWQGKLWRRIYREGRPHLARALEGASIEASDGWHLFAFSHLSPPHEALFRRVNGHFYLLSPCSLFWGDLTSDRLAARWIMRWQQEGRSEAQIEEMRSYLSDGNPLLANLGRVIQRSLAPFDNSSYLTEAYVEPGRSTRLKALQSDLLNLERLSTDSSTDRTIEICAASSRLREVELIYDRVASWVKSGVAPDSITVMAPDMGHYAPFITALFEREGEAIPYQIRDGAPPSAHSLQKGLAHLLQLATSRWEASALLKLLGHPLFAQRQGLEKGDLETIRSWVDRVGVCWGVDGAHRRQLLEAEYGEQVGQLSSAMTTWEAGFSRLLGGIVSQTVEMSCADLLGELIALTHSLRDDLAPLCDGSRMRLSEWASYLRLLVDTYFSHGEAGEFDRLEGQLLELGRDERWTDGEFGFGSIRSWIEGWLQEQSRLHRVNEVGGVRFCSMLPMRMVPAEYICLIGLEEGAFPRRTIPHPLDQLSKGSAPSAADCDRGLFLEAILSARCALYLSYPAISSQDGQPQTSSVVVAELLSYFNGALSVVESSPLPFEPTTFSGESMRDYRCAQSLASENFDPPHRLAIQFYDERPVCLPEPLLEGVIDISALRSAIRDPLRAYFQSSVRLQLEGRRLTSPQDEESFQLSHLDSYLATLRGLRGSVDGAIDEAVAFLPAGPFRDLAVVKLRREISEARHLLTSQGIDLNSWYQVTFAVGVDRPYEVEEGWVVPPIALPSRGGGVVHLTGSVSGLSPAGLTFLGENRVRDAIKGWSDFLLYCSLSFYPEIPVARQLHFAKGGGSQTAFFTDHLPLLHALVGYYSALLSAPCPVHPDWTVAALVGNSREVQTRWEGQQLFTPYVQRALPRGDLPCTERSLTTWRPLLKAAFGEMAESWFEKTLKREGGKV